MKRSVMQTKALVRAKAKIIGTMNQEGILSTSATADELAAPGFYFFGHRERQTVYARFYMGRTRSKTGLRNVVSQLRRQRSSVGVKLINAQTIFDIYYLPIDGMKEFTNAFGKGKIGQILSRVHKDSYQNLEEMNRMLNDNFRFNAQGY